MAKVGKRRRGYLFADLARCGERFIGRALWRAGATAPILQLRRRRGRSFTGRSAVPLREGAGSGCAR